MGARRHPFSSAADLLLLDRFASILETCLPRELDKFEEMAPGSYVVEVCSWLRECPYSDGPYVHPKHIQRLRTRKFMHKF
jgi:hypothetical protein